MFRPQLSIKIGLIVVLLISFVFYGLLKSRQFLSGPEIVIFEPQNGQTVSNSYSTIKGQAKNISALFINDRQVIVDEKGNFSENLMLAFGYNIIEVKAKDKFDRETKKLLEIVLK